MSPSEPPAAAVVNPAVWIFKKAISSIHRPLSLLYIVLASQYLWHLTSWHRRWLRCRLLGYDCSLA
jgi:hypothetical protein